MRGIRLVVAVWDTHHLRSSVYETVACQQGAAVQLWRVNKVLQFSCQRVLIRHITGPMVVVFLAALLVLSLWMGLDPLRWERVEINDVTGESIGECTCNNFLPFIIPLIILVLIPACSTAFMAWKTIDVDDQYAESKWIFILILLQLEVVIVSVPMVIVLRDVSTTGRYLGFFLCCGFCPMSAILSIMLPKYLAYHRAIRGVNDRNQKKRGESRGVIVLRGPSDSRFQTLVHEAYASSDLAPIASQSERNVPCDNGQHEAPIASQLECNVSCDNGQHEAHESNDDVGLSTSQSEHTVSSVNGLPEVHESNTPITLQSELSVSSDVDGER
jgi:hypothetical protein